MSDSVLVWGEKTLVFTNGEKISGMLEYGRCCNWEWKCDIDYVFKYYNNYMFFHTEKPIFTRGYLNYICSKREFNMLKEEIAKNPERFI